MGQCVEAVAQRFSLKKLFWEISQNSQENTCASLFFNNFIKKEALAQVFSCKFCKIWKNTFFYRTPPVAASECEEYFPAEIRSLFFITK